ncbi:MAG: YihY/virulence factor BrkB family protein [Chitinophagaceae bacterium]|jgi:membrane protein|nr:YihY/virulence factor BrkB family protein [Chitinophagaceae bacterium]
MKQKIVSTWKITKQTFIVFAENDVTSKSAALAFYTFFSLAPILLMVIGVGDLFYKREAIEGTLYNQIQGFVGSEAALQIQLIIKNASFSKNSLFATTISITALLLSATGVFTEIQSSINNIWQLKPKPRKGWVKYLVNRILSLSMILGLGFILMVSLIISTLMDVMMQRLLSMLPNISVWIAYGFNLGITLLITTFLFSIIFKFLPDAKIEWRDVRAGAFATAFLFMLGKFAIGYYMGKSNPAGVYGTAGSIVIILLWVYYSAIILYFGACFTKVYAQFTGREIYPTQYAVFIEQIEVQNKNSLQEQPEEKVVVKETETLKETIIEQH